MINFLLIFFSTLLEVYLILKKLHMFNITITSKIVLASFCFGVCMCVCVARTQHEIYPLNKLDAQNHDGN